MKSKLLALAACFTALVTSTVANAATVNVISVGNLSVGASGFFSSPTATGDYDTSFIGALPANSQITFSYSIPGGTDLLLGSYASYFGNNAGELQFGSAYMNSRGVMWSQGYTQSATAGTPFTITDSLVTATANLSSGTTNITGSATITNTSALLANFNNQLTGFLTGLGINISYTVTALSAVPLPAAAYLFGSGLLALAGMSRLKRKQAAA